MNYSIKIYSDGKSIKLNDGVPIGTIISYMGGTSAPKDYLICDGSEYSTDEYSDLAIFFEKQFGTKYYFGGNNDTLFCVPDMRNLFLRGFHGESSEHLSGDIGIRQDGTQHIYQSSGSHFVSSKTDIINGSALDMDSTIGSITSYWRAITSYDSAEHPIYYTSRPVNMAVLYCIKATK